MIYRSRRPGPPLSGFVEQIWYCAGYRPAHRHELVLPDGSVSFVIGLRYDSIPVYRGLDVSSESRAGAALVAGARSGAMLVHTETMEEMVGIHFRPGGARQFLTAPAGLFHEEDVELESVWGRRAGELRERLQEAATPERMFDAAEAWLLESPGLRLETNPMVEAALRELGRVPAALPVEEIGRMSGLSHRRFVETFRDVVGMTPKRYARIRRFREALRRTLEGERVSWSALALDCGYFDQAHFVHEFRAFAGVSPSAYGAARSAWDTHLRLLD